MKLTDDNVLPEERGVGDVVVHELPPLHHIMGVQLTGGVHVGHNVDTNLKYYQRSKSSYVNHECLTSLAEGRSFPDLAILGLNTPSLY